MTDSKRHIGAHLSTSGGYHKAIQSIVEKGGNCLQIFSSSPRTWKSAQVEDSSIEKFNKLREELHIGPIFFHALYLVNLADPGQTGDKSVQALIDELTLAPKMNIRGSIVHTGSFKRKDNTLSCRDEKDYPTLLGNIEMILKQTPENSLLILENAGNRKIGQTIEQLAEILEDVGNSRVRVCLDTCHLHAAGYDLNDEQRFEVFLNDFDRRIGLEKLELLHVNDSRDELNSLRDRHDNIGEGHVGINVFKNFLNNPRTKHLPFILEVPGFDGNGPDKENIDAVKRLVE